MFVSVELPADATDAQRARFDAGEGGTLSPVMCVDKAPAELADFAALRDEAHATGQPWDLVLVAALAGAAGAPPTAGQTEATLTRMAESVANGRLASWGVLFDRDGLPVSLD